MKINTFSGISDLVHVVNYDMNTTNIEVRLEKRIGDEADNFELETALTLAGDLVPGYFRINGQWYTAYLKQSDMECSHDGMWKTIVTYQLSFVNGPRPPTEHSVPMEDLLLIWKAVNGQG